MCGRYTLHLDDLSELKVLLGVQRVLVPNWRPRYNVAPTQSVPVVLERKAERTLEALRWGLVPSFAKNPSVGNKLINARVESLRERPSFRQAFAARRCIVPATGYFEWRAVPGKSHKQPIFISPREDRVMALAGLYESFVTRDGEVLDTFAIVTTEAAETLIAIHDRMPLELRDRHREIWLREGPLSDEALREVVEGARDASHLRTLEVDRRVSSPAFDEPACIEPAVPEPEPPHEQLGLFD